MEGNLLLNLYDSKHQSLGVSQSVFCSVKHTEQKLICFSDSSRSKPLFSFDLYEVGTPTSKAFTLTAASSNVRGEFICPTNSIKNNWVTSISRHSVSAGCDKVKAVVISPRIKVPSHQDVLKTPKITPHYMKPVNNDNNPYVKKATHDKFISNPMNSPPSPVKDEVAHKPKWVPSNFGNNSWSSRKISPSRSSTHRGGVNQSLSNASIFHRSCDETMQFVDMGSPALSVSHQDYNNNSLMTTATTEPKRFGSVMDRFSISELRDLLLSIPSHIRDALLKDTSDNNNIDSNNSNNSHQTVFFKTTTSPPRPINRERDYNNNNSESDISQRKGVGTNKRQSSLKTSTSLMSADQQERSLPKKVVYSAKPTSKTTASSRILSKAKLPVTKTVSKSQPKRSGSSQSFFEFLSQRRPTATTTTTTTVVSEKDQMISVPNNHSHPNSIVTSTPTLITDEHIHDSNFNNNNNNNMTDLAEWQRMTNWLYSIGMGMYIDCFRQNGISKLSIVEMLTHQDMTNMGMTKEADVLFIIQKIAEFTERTKSLSEQVLFSSDGNKLKGCASPAVVVAAVPEHDTNDKKQVKNSNLNGTSTRIPLFQSQLATLSHKSTINNNVFPASNIKKEFPGEGLLKSKEDLQMFKPSLSRIGNDYDLIDSFNRDDITTFFAGWDRLTNDIKNDRVALSSAKQAMEFYLYLHFYIVIPIILQKEQAEVDKGRDVVREHLETIVYVNDNQQIPHESNSPQPSPFFKDKDSQFLNNSPDAQRVPFQSTKEFAVLAGIVYVPNPHLNKLYSSLFKPDWKEGLKNRLILFLNSYSSKKILGYNKIHENQPQKQNLDTNVSSPENINKNHYIESNSVDLIFDNGNNYVEFSPCPSVVSQLTDNSKDNNINDDSDNNKVYKKLLNNRWFTNNEDKVINNKPNTFVISKNKRPNISKSIEVKKFDDSNSENHSQKILMKQVSVYNDILKKKKLETTPDDNYEVLNNNPSSVYDFNSIDKQHSIIVDELKTSSKEETLSLNSDAPKIRPKVNLSNCKLLSQLLPSTQSNQPTGKPTSAIALEEQYSKNKIGTLENNNIPTLFNELLNYNEAPKRLLVEHQRSNENNNNRNQLTRLPNIMDDEDDDNIKIIQQLNEKSEPVDLLEISDYSIAAPENTQTNQNKKATKQEDFDDIYFSR